MHTDLDGRVILVTGGTRGLGRAISERLCADGAIVVAAYASDRPSADQFSKETGERAWQFSARQADVTDANAVAALVDGVVAEYDRIDAAVHCAGIMRDGKISDLSLADWDDVIRTNLTSAFYLCRSVLPVMRRRHYGRIVALGSSAGVQGSLMRPNYAAAKAGLHGLIRTVAQDGAADGVSANLLIVGPTDAGMSAITPPEQVAALRKRMPIGRQVTAAEVAHAARFLVDPLAGGITGASIAVDGGISM